MHDVWGHNLSVIALKSQVARRLLDRDSAAAGSALSDVERVAHESLREMRELVSGLRERSLREELESAREVLAAAGIDLSLDAAVDAVAPEVDTLLAWVVREGVANVIRHSHARRVAIALACAPGSLALEISDDGGEGAVHADGSGLRGLRERIAAMGGRMDAGPRDGGGFRLWVSVPEPG